MSQPPTGALFCVDSVNADFQLRVERRPEPGATPPGHDYTRLSGAMEATMAHAAPVGSVLTVDHEIPGEVVARAVDAARERGLPVRIEDFSLRFSDHVRAL